MLREVGQHPEGGVIGLFRGRYGPYVSHDGVIASLPFHVGKKPARGQTVAVLLANTAPYARVHIPTALRAKVKTGSALAATSRKAPSRTSSNRDDASICCLDKMAS